MVYSGAKLRAERKDLGLSPTEGAFKAGLAASYLVDLEAGRAPINGSALVKIARGWGLSFDALEARLGVGGTANN